MTGTTVPRRKNWDANDRADPPEAKSGGCSSVPSRQIQLPGHAEAVLDPCEAAAEAVVVERHQEFAALAEGRAEFGELLFALARDE